MATVKTTLQSNCMIGFGTAFNPNKFLFEINSVLKDTAFDKKMAGNIVNHYSKAYDLNQRWILIALETEQGLLHKKTPEEVEKATYWKHVGFRTMQTGKEEKFAVNLFKKDEVYQCKPNERITKVVEMRILDWCVGYAVPDDGVNEKCKGFEKQIEGGCATYRRWYNAFKDGMPKELLDKDCKVCYPENAITFSTLMYTPHLAVLKAKETAWSKYFG